ncbi:MAG: helix-turn-helix domain-containing protein [Actinomycetota bacterium]
MNPPAPASNRHEQARTTTTKDAFLDAAEQLFAERGVAATPVTDVVETADRSIGSLYHHFTNKDGLVAAVVDRLLDQLELGVTLGIDPDRWQGSSIEDVVTGYVTSSLRTAVGRPGYKRILVEVSFTDPEVDRRYREARRRLDAGLVDLLLARRNEIGHASPETAARFAIDQLTGMLAARLEAATPTQLDDAPDEVFAAEAVASVVAHLALG